MTVLSDKTIRRLVKLSKLGIVPFQDNHVQPASYDLTLAQDVILEPGQCQLADTIEIVRLPNGIRGELSGRSSVARLFVFTHCQGGYVDPGFEGTLTLELFNASPTRHVFLTGDRIIQISFAWLDQESDGYSGRYLHQSGPTPSRFHHGEQ